MGTRDHPVLENQPYFVTATIQGRRPLFRNRDAADLLIRELDQLRSQLGFALLGYAVMPDHLHLVLVPGPAVRLSRIMRFVKGRFARLWNQRSGVQGSLWQPRFYESGVRTEAQLNRWIDYIHSNPVRAGLAASADEYAYCSAGAKPPTDLDAFLRGTWTGQAKARPSGDNKSALAKNMTRW